MSQRLFAALFVNRTSIGLLSLVLLVGVATLPNLGVISAWVFLLVAVLVGIRRGSLVELGFRRPESWTRTVLMGLVLGIVVQLAFSIVIDPLIERLTGSTIDISALDPMRGSVVPYLLMLLIGWVVGGFLEEMLFRGYLLNRLKRVLGEGRPSVTVAVLLPSVAFGMAHSYQDISGMLSTGRIGFILGVVFVWNGYNLWLPILIHGFLDMVGLTLIFTDADKVLNSLLF
jgi:membrane protease YdiL (CAAX protease family)